MKTTMRATLILVAAAALMSSIDAFSSNIGSLSSAKASELRLKNAKRKTTMFVQDPSMHEGIPSEKGEQKTQSEKADQQVEVKNTVRNAGKKVGLAGLYGFSFFMNIVGLYFTAGLILNLCGYAYEFSFEEGYKIDTIEHRRIERQFEQQSKRYEREHAERVAQFSTKGAADMFGSETVTKLSSSSK